jgi:hypothetical protein
MKIGGSAIAIISSEVIVFPWLVGYVYIIPGAGSCCTFAGVLQLPSGLSVLCIAASVSLF